MRYLIAYDIVDDRRRTSVYKYLSGWGRRIQKSVFECELNTQELEEVHQQLEGRITPSEDRCHFYRICADCHAARSVLGEDLEPDWGNVVVA